MGKIKDLTGKSFGRLTVLERAENSKSGKIQWKCRCECGNTTIVQRGNLTSGHTQSCGCIWKESISGEDITGKKFGMLTAIEKIPNTKRLLWRCICECGKETISRREWLLSGGKKSCGCLSKKHGKTGTRLHNIWCTMKQRCYNPNSQKFYRYGARGITICNEWKNDFKSFYSWAMANGYQDNLTIDRIDNDGNYDFSNCRWITSREQMSNYSKNHLVTYKGETKTIQQWSEVTGIKPELIRNRIVELGWTVERALTEKPYKGKNQYSRKKTS